MLEDDAVKKKPKWPELGGDLGPLSIQDLNDYIAALETEIARVRADMAQKDTARGGAEALFKR